MQKKPQLSAEMEKRFDEELMRYSTDDPMGRGSVETNPTAVKAFLATALEEQRAKYVEQVKTMPCTYREDNLYRQDVIDLLNRKE